jgi:hypothetical protein
MAIHRCRLAFGATCPTKFCAYGLRRVHVRVFAAEFRLLSLRVRIAMLLCEEADNAQLFVVRTVSVHV